MIYHKVVACIISLLSSLFFIQCSTNTDQTRSNLKELKAAIAASCITTINYEDNDDNVYTYRADDIFDIESVQVGGHSTPDESTDLGINIFGIGTGIYFVDGGSIELGSAYVFYINAAGNEYISTSNNQGSITVSEFNMDSDEIITHIKINFHNVEVAFNNETLCINNFSLTFNL